MEAFASVFNAANCNRSRSMFGHPSTAQADAVVAASCLMKAPRFPKHLPRAHNDRMAFAVDKLSIGQKIAINLICISLITKHFLQNSLYCRVVIV